MHFPVDDSYIHISKLQPLTYCSQFLLYDTFRFARNQKATVTDSTGREAPLICATSYYDYRPNYFHREGLKELAQQLKQMLIQWDNLDPNATVYIPVYLTQKDKKADNSFGFNQYLTENGVYFIQPDEYMNAQSISKCCEFDAKQVSEHLHQCVKAAKTFTDENGKEHPLCWQYYGKAYLFKKGLNAFLKSIKEENNQTQTKTAEMFNVYELSKQIHIKPSLLASLFKNGIKENVTFTDKNGHEKPMFLSVRTHYKELVLNEGAYDAFLKKHQDKFELLPEKTEQMLSVDEIADKFSMDYKKANALVLAAIKEKPTFTDKNGENIPMFVRAVEGVKPCICLNVAASDSFGKKYVLTEPKASKRNADLIAVAKTLEDAFQKQ